MITPLLINKALLRESITSRCLAPFLYHSGLFQNLALSLRGQLIGRAGRGFIYGSITGALSDAAFPLLRVSQRRVVTQECRYPSVHVRSGILLIYFVLAAPTFAAEM
jgi:hypothetical protein